MVENSTTTNEAATTILGTTITLIAISVYQLKIMLFTLSAINLASDKSRVDLKEPTT